MQVGYMRVDVLWVVAVVSDRAWSIKQIHLIDGQRLTVDEPYEVVMPFVQICR